MIHIYAEFEDYEAARAFMIRTLNDYDPLGYGTTLSIKGQRMADKSIRYIVTGNRYASCD